MMDLLSLLAIISYEKFGHRQAARSLPGPKTHPNAGQIANAGRRVEASEAKAKLAGIAFRWMIGRPYLRRAVGV